MELSEKNLLSESDQKLEEKIKIKTWLKNPKLELSGWDLFNSCAHGQDLLVKLAIASGKPIYFGHSDQITFGKPVIKLCDLYQVAFSNEHYDLAQLIRFFEMDPVETRKKLQQELKWPISEPAGIFALIIFVCDDFLKMQAE